MDIKEYKLANSIWIFSCNDLPPQMTYNSLKKRIPDVNEKEIKNIVIKFPELYQSEIPKKQLDDWKEQMKGGKYRPKWVAKLPTEANPEKIIDNIKVKDVFRSRFRNSINASPSDKEVLKWGLSYLDDIYSLEDKKSDRNFFKLTNFILPLISLIIAGYSIWSTNRTSDMQVQIQKIQLEREIILPQYKQFVSSLNAITIKLNENIELPINYDFQNLRKSLFELSPYIPNSDYKEILNEIQLYYNLIVKIKKESSITEKQKEELIDRFLDIETKVRNSVNVLINIKN